MTAVLTLPGVLRAHAGGQAEVDVQIDGATSTVRTVLDAVSVEHPALVRRIRDEQGELRRFVNLYVDDTDVRDLRGLETAVPDGARLLVIASVRSRDAREHARFSVVPTPVIRACRRTMLRTGSP